MSVKCRHGGRFYPAASILLFSLFGVWPAVTALSGSAQPRATAIDSLENVWLGGVRQKILIEGDDPTRPILLWLHGGPGSSQMLLSHYYSKRLRDQVVMVNWDTRGASLSYDEGKHPETLDFQRMISDTVELTDLLCKRFKQEKIYLLGHSFGSVLGMHVVSRFPQRYHAYIGMGQVIDPIRSPRLVRNWVESEMRRAEDSEGLRALWENSVPLIELVRRYGGMRHNPDPSFADVVRASPYYFDGYLDLHTRSRRFVEANLKGSNAERDRFIETMPVLELPVYFFEGRFDRCPAATPGLVVEYCARLKAPAKEIIWFEQSAHHPNLEQPEEFQDAILRVVSAYNATSGRQD